jgi:hypothetical protein
MIVTIFLVFMFVIVTTEHFKREGCFDDPNDNVNVEIIAKTEPPTPCSSP